MFSTIDLLAFVANEVNVFYENVYTFEKAYVCYFSEFFEGLESRFYLYRNNTLFLVLKIKTFLISYGSVLLDFKYVFTILYLHQHCE